MVSRMSTDARTITTLNGKKPHMMIAKRAPNGTTQLTSAKYRIIFVNCMLPPCGAKDSMVALA
jgi:hypothetical protein